MDDSLSGFWSSFCRPFYRLDTERAEKLKQMGLPRDITSMERALELMQGMLPQGKTILVLDDYHLADCPEVSSFIQFLLWNELTNLHIVLTARYVKDLNLQELSIKGYLLHIQKDALEFSADDILSYYRRCGLSVNEDTGKKLYTYTEGWVSAIYLLMLGYKKKALLRWHPVYLL
jgi:LuxR family maltose regulon positive regulatory protein